MGFRRVECCWVAARFPVCQLAAFLMAASSSCARPQSGCRCQAGGPRAANVDRRRQSFHGAQQVPYPSGNCVCGVVSVLEGVIAVGVKPSAVSSKLLRTNKWMTVQDKLIAGGKNPRTPTFQGWLTALVPETLQGVLGRVMRSGNQASAEGELDRGEALTMLAVRLQTMAAWNLQDWLTALAPETLQSVLRTLMQSSIQAS